MNRHQKDLSRLLIKSAALPTTATMPSHVAADPSKAQRWLRNQNALANSKGPGVLGRGVMAIGNAGDAAANWADRESEKGYFGHTRNSTGLGKVPGLLTDVVRAPVNLIAGGATNYLRGAGRAGNIFWNGSDGKSDNLLWRAGAKAVNRAGDVARNSSFSTDGVTKRAPVVSSDRDTTFWSDTLGAGANFGGAMLDGFGAAAPFAGGLVTTPARSLLSRAAQGAKTVATNAAKTTGGMAGLDVASSALGLKDEPLEVSPEAAAAYEQNQGNAYGPTGQPFDPAALSNLLAFLMPYLQQGQGRQGYQDPQYMSAIDRAANNVRG